VKRNRRKIDILLSVGVFLAFVFSPSISFAGSTMHPSITKVKLYIEEEHLTGEISSTGLFSEKIVGTIQSGLPAVVKLDYKLVEIRNYTKIEGEISWSLQYDLWDDRYLVSSGDTITILDSFESMKHMMENLKAVSFFPIRRMLRGRSYYLALRISVNPFRKNKAAAEISDKVGESIRSNDENSRREKLLNINSMVSWFLKRRKGKAGISGWYRSAVFNPENLAKYGGEVH